MEADATRGGSPAGDDRELDREIERIEEAIADGSTDLRALGFWRIVGRVKRDPALVERYADRLGRIDTAAFRARVNPRLPVAAGNVLLAAGAVAGGIAVWLAFAAGSSLLKGVFLLAAGGIWTVALHCPAHWVVGRAMGIRFTDYFLGGPPPPRPGLKTDYATYLRTPASRRAWMHASGAIATKLAPLVALAFWPASGAPGWSALGLIAMFALVVLTDVTLSVKTSDWARFRRERAVARSTGGRATRSALVLALTLSLVAVAAACGGSDEPSPSATASEEPATGLVAIDPAGLAEELQAAVDAVMEEHSVPGVIAGVWTPAGEWAAATGDAGDRPIALDDGWAIRSVTKSFVVTVLLQLAGEDVVSLDDTVDTYLEGVPSGDEITLAQLAGMTSGLFDYSQSEPFQQGLIEDFTREYTTDELLSFAFDQPLDFEPGTQYSYSNTNTLVVGEVIEAATGNTLTEELNARVFEPLGLSRTAYNTEGSTVPDPSTPGFLIDDDGSAEPIEVSFSAFGAAGAMTSALDDLHRWGEALGSGELLTPEIQAERLDAAQPATDGPEYEVYGLGIGQIGGWWGHTGSGLGYQDAVFREPESGAVIVVALNTAPQQDAQAELIQRLQDVLAEA